MSPSLAFGIVWIGWFASWMAAAFWRGRTVKQAPLRETWPWVLPVIAGGILFFHRTGRALAMPMLWHVGLAGASVLVGVAVLGFVFSWWARIHMGRLWDGGVTLKENHRVIDTGPFALVRHPIYFGVIVALLATAIAKATAFGIAGFVFIVVGIVIKARMEEHFLSDELGPGYDAYAARVPMLIPFLPT